MLSSIVKKKTKRYLKRHFRGFEGKTAIVTGASGAIGKQIASSFLELGMTVILPALPNECDPLRAELSTGYDIKKIITYPIDLTNLDSIKSFVAQIQDKNINYLVNNAGVIGKLDYLVNFRGTLELTLALLPILNKSKDSRVVFQSSFSYRMAHIDWKEPNKFWSDKKLKSYAVTKRLVNLSIVALKADYMKKYPNVKIAIAHPGAVASDINGKATKLQRAISKPFLHTAETAALSAVYAAFKPVPDKKLVGPRGFGIWGRPKKRPLDKRLFNPSEQERISKLLHDEKLI